MQPPSPHSRACLQEKVSPIRDTIFVGANTYSPGDSEAGQNITLPISSTEYSQVNAEFICRGSTTAPTGKIMLPDPALEAAHAVADEDPRIPSVRRHLAKPHQPAGSRPCHASYSASGIMRSPTATCLFNMSGDTPSCARSASPSESMLMACTSAKVFVWARKYASQSKTANRGRHPLPPAGRCHTVQRIARADAGNRPGTARQTQVARHRPDSPERDSRGQSLNQQPARRRSHKGLGAESTTRRRNLALR